MGSGKKKTKRSGDSFYKKKQGEGIVRSLMYVWLAAQVLVKMRTISALLWTTSLTWPLVTVADKTIGLLPLNQYSGASEKCRTKQ